jgi:prepilin signal peptidase PulO-like enzyme (type II secretory pathway)
LSLILVAFAVAGSWAAAWAVSFFSEKRIYSWSSIACVGAIDLWSICAIYPNVQLLIITLLLGWGLLVLALADSVAYRLPNALTYPLIAAGLLVSSLVPIPDLQQGLIAHAVGAVGGFVTLWAVAAGFRYLRGYEGLGLGDAKLFAAAGAWLGWRPLPIVLLMACLMGLFWVGLRSIVQGRKSLNERLPFGAPLCAAFWLVWLYARLFYGALF